MNDVISSIWYSIKLPLLSEKQIGIVAVRCRVTGKIKFYIGLAKGEDLQKDEEIISRLGVPFYPSPIIDWVISIRMSEKLRKETDKTE